MKKIIITLLVSSLIIGCDETSTENNNLENLENTSWMLESFKINGVKVIPPINQTYEISFLENNRIEGINDCNEIIAKYKIEDNKIKIFYIGGTKVGCGNDSMDKIFNNLLASSEKFICNKEMLVLTCSKNSQLKFGNKLNRKVLK